MKAIVGLALMVMGVAGMLLGAWSAVEPVIAVYREALEAPLESEATGEGVARSMAPGLTLGASGAATYVLGVVIRRLGRVRRGR